ncbi:MAG: hypothetical protein GY797_35560 [Deltaproteobacteria bacterium]|nr:hypothetical protein [Deltaproteobacteria bacterium]
MLDNVEWPEEVLFWFFVVMVALGALCGGFYGWGVGGVGGVMLFIPLGAVVGWIAAGIINWLSMVFCAIVPPLVFAVIVLLAIGFFLSFYFDVLWGLGK